ncbi:MAG: hypothetical protein IIT45_06670, partial [Treponema sp.]|nr:hypothetical protein [Treponema sp.]
KYFECVKIGNEIKNAIERMKNTAGSPAANESPAALQQAEAPREEKTCPSCGAKTFPNQNGCCEYCGSAL